MSFHNIPEELRLRRQWIVWRIEWRADDPDHLLKPTKVPYVARPGGGKASVTNSFDWVLFDEACLAPFTCNEPVDPTVPLEVSGYTGLGFVFTEGDDYTGIDLDDVHGDVEAYNRQLKIFREFNSYAELSPSGTGVHIIVKGKIPGDKGRRRAFIELYSRERYFTMTGNVIHNVPIAERQELINVLYEQMGPPVKELPFVKDQPETATDDEIIAMARRAENGAKFSALYDGDWSPLYNGDQSRADFALVDIIAFYSKNQAQITRLFLNSQLGQRDKAQKRPAYVEYMVKRSFDKMLPSIDLEQARKALDDARSKVTKGFAEGDAAGQPGSKPAASVALPEPANGSGAQAGSNDGSASHGSGGAASPVVFPPGLVGEIAEFILAVSPRPVPQISLSAAIALVSSICGRSYNVSGSGLNQYILMLAMTGTGKDAVSVGTSKLIAAVKATVPSVVDFQGPGELVSSAGLIKWLAKKPAVLSILGEFGAKMQEMASPNANSHLKGLERVLLQMYSKSGAGNVFDPMAYSDVEKNTQPLNSPSLTILAESVPDRFYRSLDESFIASGLLQRFMIYEYTGDRAYLNEGTERILPSIGLVENLSSLVAHSLSLSAQGHVLDVPMTSEARALFNDFDRWTTDEINTDKSEIKAQMWNRAHLKAMKLAATIAVGINYHGPLITIDEARYATNEIVEQTKRIMGKFEAGEVGNAHEGESKQRDEVIKAIGRYLVEDFEAVKKYGATEEMHKSGVITMSVIQRRLISMACFKNDKFGASNAIKRAVDYLLQSDELREMAADQMSTRFGTKAKAFIPTSPTIFLNAVRTKKRDA